jgi:hypothetical protein
MQQQSNVDPVTGREYTAIEQARLDAAYRILIGWYESVLDSMSDEDKRRLLASADQHTADAAVVNPQ